jgi:ubiquinone/menaquinone biosynthesis C-methylase UbiE
VIRSLAGKVRRRVVRATAVLMGRDAPVAPPTDAPATVDPVDRSADQWFWDHWDWAPIEVLGFLREDGFDVTGLEVADVGCGDGIIDLGLVQHGGPRRLVGFDVNPEREDLLLERAVAAGVADALPPALEFAVSDSTKLPAADDAFDVVVTWSAFEHIDDPAPVLAEIRRVLRPGGVLFLQLWPFYDSQHGAHLEEWYPDGFVQFQRDTDEIEADVLQRAEDAGWAKYKLGEYRTLNEITVDDLGHLIEAAGFRITKVQLISQRSQLPPEVAGMDLTRVGVSGVMLLAR